MSEDEGDKGRSKRRTLAGSVPAILWAILWIPLSCLPMEAHAQQIAPQPPSQTAPQIAKGTSSNTAPQPAQNLPATPAATGTISGTVTDVDGDLVPGARVALTRGGARGERTITTDGEGAFRFDAVFPGSFELSVVAHGMASGSAGGTLLAGQMYQAPPVVLAIATASESIQVSIPRQEVAEEQVKDEERQRVIGIIPNYFVTYSRDPAPLDAKQKFDLGWHVMLDPTNFLFSGVAAGIEQADNTFPGYRQGAQGFGKRYGAALANASVSTLLRGSVFPSLLRQDPRYYYRGTGAVPSRATYALETAVICKGDNGRWQPNYSSFLGNLSSGAISNLYYPASSRNGPALTFENALLGIVGVGAGHLMQEFLFRRFTHNAPHAGTSP